MTDAEMIELEELRAFKRSYSALERSFDRLEMLLDAPYSKHGDSILSVRAFRVVADCLLELKREVLE